MQLLDLLEKIWSGRKDSNPRPQPWQGCALPLTTPALRWLPGGKQGAVSKRVSPGWQPGDLLASDLRAGDLLAGDLRDRWTHQEFWCPSGLANGGRGLPPEESHDRRNPSGRRATVGALEVPRHMALIGKSSLDRRLGERGAVAQQSAHVIQLAQGAEAARAGSEQGAELPRERPAVEPGEKFKLGHRVPPRRAGGDQVANARQRRDDEARPVTASRPMKRRPAIQSSRRRPRCAIRHRFPYRYPRRRTTTLPATVTHPRQGIGRKEVLDRRVRPE